MHSDDYIRFIGGGGDTFNILNTCVGGVVYLAGNWNTVTNNSGGAVTIIYAQQLTSTRDQGVYKNQAIDWQFMMFDATTGLPATGLTVTGTVALDGASPVAVTGTITEIGLGWYEFAAVAADTNADKIGWQFTTTGAHSTSITLPGIK